MEQLDLANIALGHLGTVSLGDYNEVSPEGIQVRRQWDLVRDGLLRRRAWNFAIKRTALALNGLVTPTACSTTAGSAVVTCASTSGLAAGMNLTGPGVPLGTTVLSVTDPTYFVLSQNATATAVGLTLSASIIPPADCSTTAGSAVVTCASTSGLAAGMNIAGPGVSWGATVLSVTDSTHFVLSLNATATAAGLTLSASIAPAFGWKFAYVLPSDYILALSFDDRNAGTGQAHFEIEGSLLLCNVATKANLRYVFQQTDPTAWDESFCEAFTLKLASRIAAGLTTANSLAGQLDQRAEQYLTAAFGSNSQETRPRAITAQSDSGWMKARMGFGFGSHHEG